MKVKNQQDPYLVDASSVLPAPKSFRNKWAKKVTYYEKATAMKKEAKE